MKEERNEKHLYMVPFTIKFRAMLLLEVARSRGLRVWVENGNRYEVCLCAREEDVRAAVQTARDAEEILHLRQLEALASTLREIGERPSEELTRAIDFEKHKVGFEGGNTVTKQPGLRRLNSLN